MAYLLIMPAALLICAIAIWPVLRSFWISLYDIRLNDPTKSEIHAEYALNMEKYTETMPILLRILGAEAAEGGAVKDRLEPLRQRAEEMKNELEADPAFKARYEKIDRLLFDFQPVPEELKYFELDRELALKLRTELGEMLQILKQVKEEGLMKRPDDPIGLIGALMGTFMEPNFVGLGIISGLSRIRGYGNPLEIPLYLRCALYRWRCYSVC